MVRMVWPQRPQTEPAPHASATCLVERAPASMACWTVLVVTPRQRQMYISGPGHLEGLHQAADEQRRVRADPRLRHEPSRGVGVADPLLRLAFGRYLLQDHHLGLVVQGAVDPEAAHAGSGEPGDGGVDAGTQPVHPFELADRGD